MGKDSNNALITSIAIQTGFLLLFIFIMYFQETYILGTLQASVNLDSMQEMSRYLHSQKGFLQPGEFWRLMVPFLLISIVFIFPFRIRWYMLFVFGFLSSLFLVSNRIYDKFFSSLIDFGSLRATPQLWQVRKSIIAEVTSADLIILTSFVLLFIIFIFLKKHILPTKKKVFDFLTASIFLYFSFCSWQVTYAYFFDFQRMVIGESHIPFFATSQRGFSVVFGLYNGLADSSYQLISGCFNNKEMDEDAFKQVEQTLNARFRLNQTMSPFFGLAANRNVIMISLESFQKFLVDLKAGETEISPTINSLAKNGLSFNNIVEMVSKGGSADAEFTALTGLLPDERKMAAAGHPTNNTLLAIPKYLHDTLGYQTFSMHGNNASFWFRNVNHPRYGFEHMYFRPQFSKNIFEMGIDDQTFFKESADILIKEAKPPFLAYLISLSCHHPFLVPDQYKRLNVGLDDDTKPAGYLKTSRFTDDAIDTFFLKFRDSEMFNSTMFVIFGDHTAPFFNEDENRIFEEKLNINPGSLHLKKIPLIFYIPGKEPFISEHKEEFQDTVGGLQDLFPTILHLLGKEIPYGLFGTHLFVKNENRLVTPWYKIVAGYIYHGILYSGARGKPVGSEIDPLFIKPDESDLPIQNYPEGYDIRNTIQKVHETIFDFDAQKLAIKKRNAKKKYINK